MLGGAAAGAPASRRRGVTLARRVAFVCVLAAGAATAAGGAHVAAAKQAPGTWCGGTRWRLMTLSDGMRKRVQLRSRPTSIAQIGGLRPPGRYTRARPTPFERQVWRMETVLDRYRIASNGEIVLILYSIASGLYMNAYMPNPECLGPRARDRTGMIAARREFREHCPAPTAQWQLIGATVDLAGVGFWNPVRTTRGALGNGGELRPVTNFRLIAGCGVG